MFHDSSNTFARARESAETPARQDEAGRFCLNDLHRAAGEEQRHRPKYWLENQQTTALLIELEKGGIPPIEAKQGLGTYVVKELVYAYAMWISPAFHLDEIFAEQVFAKRRTPAKPSGRICTLGARSAHHYARVLRWCVEPLPSLYGLAPRHAGYRPKPSGRLRKVCAHLVHIELTPPTRELHTPLCRPRAPNRDRQGSRRTCHAINR